ncbi:SgcJ/EcaC family oxidoreductase [Dyadobacter sp. CY326]|uniref:SgcJ/EcaC family oxidoreductase n=1 Tax=Dyadobacter sp. CY326 TaxID=2907300 RepID=UPI001F35C782|nr:SgcJ/EcaC family oxidoreductase [Dyadobacter sp. CY326]MCE7065166.1 SgcJ/EcaC family oxidoreductase [Dyadobacter sp. CY326]
MKKRMLALIVFSFLLPQVTIAQVDNQASRQEAIKLVISNYEQAWNRHDAKALAEQYHTDASWVNWFGAYYKGRVEIEKHYQTTHATYFKATQFTTRSVEDITFLKPDMALVHVRTDLSGDERYPGQTFRFRRTILLTNKDGGWRIAAGQNAKLNEGID